MIVVCTRAMAKAPDFPEESAFVLCPSQNTKGLSIGLLNVNMTTDFFFQFTCPFHAECGKFEVFTSKMANFKQTGNLNQPFAS